MMAVYALSCILALRADPLPPLPQPLPAVTTTPRGTPGDPVNLVLIGTREELCSAFHAAGWSVADPITARSAVRIGVSVALKTRYPAAPVSDLVLFGRTQDLAFERTVGPSARTRHHVRFWQACTTLDGRAVWVGSGTFDERVGRSPATGRLTHRIAPDVDTERDFILSSLEQAGGLTAVSLRPGSGPTTGFNGEGDCYYTNGAVAIGMLVPRPTQLLECGSCRRFRWGR